MKPLPHSITKAKEWFRRALDAGYEPDEEDRALLEDVFGEGFSRQRIIEEMVVDYGSYGQACQTEFFNNGKYRHNSGRCNATDINFTSAKGRYEKSADNRRIQTGFR